MTDFYVSFLPWLKPDRHFEIFKIVLDKGMLAIVVALAGLMFSVLLERYKSVLKRQEELAKLIGPGVAELKTESQSLLDAGIRVLDTLDQQFEHFVHWSDAIFECKAEYYEPEPDQISESGSPTRQRRRHPSRLGSMPEAPEGPEFLDRKIKCSIVETSTIRELLEQTADYLVMDVIRSANFSANKEHYAQGGFFYELHNNIRASAKARDDFNALFRTSLQLGMIKSVFIPFTSCPRNTYVKKVQEFKLAVMRQTPLGTRKQDRAIDLIRRVAENMVDFVMDYPTHDAVKVIEFGQKGKTIDIDTRQALWSGHAAILTQIHYLMG